MLVVVATTGSDESQSTGVSDVQSGLLGASCTPLPSQPCKIKGFATVGALENRPLASACEQVYVPGPTKHFNESDPLKSNPVITVLQLPAENNAARSFQVVPSAAPAPDVLKYLVTIAMAHLRPRFGAVK